METKKAIIPHKDTAFFLAKMAKFCIETYNVGIPQDEVYKKTFPVFPQWILLDDLPNKITNIELNLPLKNKTELYFPVKIFFEQDDSQKTIDYIEEKIKFARFLNDSESEKEISNFPLEFLEKFPMRIKIFRTGTVHLTETSWNLFDEKWHKLR